MSKGVVSGSVVVNMIVGISGGVEFVDELGAGVVLGGGVDGLMVL